MEDKMNKKKESVIDMLAKGQVKSQDFLKRFAKFYFDNDIKPDLIAYHPVGRKGTIPMPRWIRGTDHELVFENESRTITQCDSCGKPFKIPGNVSSKEFVICQGCSSNFKP